MKEKVEELQRRLAGEEEKLAEEKRRTAALNDANKALESKVCSILLNETRVEVDLTRCVTVQISRLQHSLEVQRGAFEKTIADLTLVAANGEAAFRAKDFEESLQHLRTNAVEVSPGNYVTPSVHARFIV